MSKMNSGIADISAYLNLFVYLDEQKIDYNNKSLGEILKMMKERHIYSDNPKSDKYNDRYAELIEGCKKNPNLANLKLISQSHFEDYPNAHKGSTCADDYITACAFVDGKGNAYVAYRGTGDGRWIDNAVGYTQESTDMQLEAKEYFDGIYDKISSDHIYVSGHSKGGNEAQYVTMTADHRDQIDGCYSFDGQGFSNKAIDYFRRINGGDAYDEALDKMYSINGEDDPVHELINPIIPQKNTYYVHNEHTDRTGKDDWEYVHSLNRMMEDGGLNWWRDSNGNITRGEQGELGKYAKQINQVILTLPEEQQEGLAKSIMHTIEVVSNDDKGNTYVISGIGGNSSSFKDWVNARNDLFPVIVMGTMEHLKDEGKINEVIADVIIAYGYLVIAVKLLGQLELEQFYETVVEFVKKVKEICVDVGKWAMEIIRITEGYLKKVAEYLYTHSPGYLYSAENPEIVINTTKMYQYARDLDNISKRMKNLDGRMNSLYLSASFDWNIFNSLANIGNLLQAELLMDFSLRLDANVLYLKDTAGNFEKAERKIIGMLE